MQQDISKVKYVGPSTAKRLSDHGIHTIKQLVALSVEELAAIPGIGHYTAPLILASAQEVLDMPVLKTSEVASSATPVEASIASVKAELIPAPVEMPFTKVEVLWPEVDTDNNSNDFPKKKTKEQKKAEKAADKAAKKLAKKADKLAKKAEKKKAKEEKKAKKAEKKKAKEEKKAKKAAKDQA